MTHGEKFEARVERVARGRYKTRHPHWDELSAEDRSRMLDADREELGFGINGCGREGFPCHEVIVVLADFKDECGVIVRNTDTEGDHRWEEGFAFLRDAEQLAFSIQAAHRCVEQHVNDLENEPESKED